MSNTEVIFFPNITISPQCLSPRSHVDFIKRRSKSCPPLFSSIQKGRTPGGITQPDAQPFFVVMFSRRRIVCVFQSLTNYLELRHVELRSFGKHGVLAQAEAVECIELSSAGSVLASKLAVGHLLVHGDCTNSGLGRALARR